MRNKYGLRVSPWIVPQSMGIGLVWPKCVPVSIVEGAEYIEPTRVIASVG
jgi:hypothetical protein